MINHTHALLAQAPIRGYCTRFWTRDTFGRRFTSLTRFGVGQNAQVNGDSVRVDIPLFWWHGVFPAPPGYEGEYDIGQVVALKRDALGLFMWGYLFPLPWRDVLLALMRYGILHFSIGGKIPPDDTGNLRKEFIIKEISLLAAPADPSTLAYVDRQTLSGVGGINRLQGAGEAVLREVPRRYWEWIEAICEAKAEMLSHTQKCWYPIIGYQGTDLTYHEKPAIIKERRGKPLTLADRRVKRRLRKRG